MASAGPNHLTAEDACQSLLFKQYGRTCFRYGICDFSTLLDVSFQRSLLLSGKWVGQSRFVNVLSCLVGVLANTPGGVKRSGLGAHAVGFLVVY